MRAEDKEAPRIERLARTDQVVPPADVVRLLGVVAGDVVRGVQRMADEHRVRALRIELAVRLVRDFVRRELGTAFQPQRLLEAGLLRRDGADGRRIMRSVHVSLAVFVRRPQADANRRARIIAKLASPLSRGSARRSQRRRARLHRALRAYARRGAAHGGGTPAPIATTRRAPPSSGCDLRSGARRCRNSPWRRDAGPPRYRP